MKKHNWNLVAQTIAKTIAASNAEAETLDKVHLFVDPETGDAEITNTDKFSTCPLYVGPLSLFDEQGLMTIDDADSNYVLNLVIEIIEDASLEDYEYIEEYIEEDDEEDDEEED
jgi:hypothetical protein